MRASVDVRPTRPGDALPAASIRGLRRLPRASRRRGPGRIAPRRRGVARRFAHTPWEYPCADPRAPSGAPGRGAQAPIGRSGVRSPARRRLDGPVSRLTPLRARSYHPPDDDAPCARGRRARLRASRGRTDRPRGRMERIPRTSPDEADLPAQEAPSRQGARLPRPDEDDRGSPRPGRAAGTRSKAADGLTSGRGTSTPRLVMLSRPKDFAAIQGAGRPVPPPALRPVPADRPRDDPVRAVDRAQARRRGRPQPGPPATPRGAQGDGALVPAWLGRPHHRPARDRRGRP